MGDISYSAKKKKGDISKPLLRASKYSLTSPSMMMELKPSSLASFRAQSIVDAWALAGLQCINFDVQAFKV